MMRDRFGMAVCADNRNMKKIHHFFTGLSATLAFWFCVSSVILTLILAQVIEQTASTALREEIGQRLADLAFQTTDKLDRGMFERYREVQLMADRREIGDPAVAVIEKQKLLDHMQETYQYFAWLGISDTDGKVVAGSQGILQGADISKRPWFSNALHGVHIGDVHEAKLLAKLLPASTTNEPIRFVDVAFPFMRPDGSVGGVIGAHLSWAWARTVEQSVITSLARSRRIDAMIVGSNGTILLGPPGLQGTMLKGARGDAVAHVSGDYAVETWADGKSYLVGYSVSHGYSTYPGFGWTVLVRQNTSEAFAPIRKIQQKVLWIGFTVALLFSLFGIFNARRISRPLEALARKATRLRFGEDVDLGKIDESYQEINALATTYSALLSDLQKNEAALKELNLSLEARVAQRTDEMVRSEQKLRTITDNLPVLISYIDREYRMTFLNGTFREWIGIEPERAIGHTVSEIIGPTLFEQRRENMVRALNGERVVFDLTSTARNIERHLHTTYIPDRQADGAVIGFYTLSSDVSAMKEVEKTLTQMARFDGLTGLPNRQQLDEKLAEALARSRRLRMPLALLFLDIDYFKSINDTHGHAAGDEVLQEFSNRLRQVVRATDTVARLAGDEFVVLLEGLHDHTEAQAVAEKILQAVRQRFLIAGNPMAVTTSIGIAISNDSQMSAQELIAHADKSLYAAKAAGRDRFALATL